MEDRKQAGGDETRDDSCPVHRQARRLVGRWLLAACHDADEVEYRIARETAEQHDRAEITVGE